MNSGLKEKTPQSKLYRMTYLSNISPKSKNDQVRVTENF